MAKKRLLLVDDDPLFLKAITRMLKDNGYDVRSAQNGKQGLELLDEFNPDLVVLDAVMPVMDGFAVLQTIRAQCDIPVLMISGYASLNEAIADPDNIPDSYMTKPFHKQDFLDAIAYLISCEEE